MSVGHDPAPGTPRFLIILPSRNSMIFVHSISERAAMILLFSVWRWGDKKQE